MRHINCRMTAVTANVLNQQRPADMLLILEMFIPICRAVAILRVMRLRRVSPKLVQLKDCVRPKNYFVNSRQ